MIVIFDIDGTLADADHRLHWIQTNPKNWAAFYSGIPNDPAIESICNLARLLYANQHIIVFCTGRDYEHYHATWDWLQQHEIHGHGLYMRPNGDRRPDYEVKQDLLAKIRQEHGNPDLVFEDRQKVVDMWRRNGIRCLQVAEGRY